MENIGKNEECENQGTATAARKEETPASQGVQSCSESKVPADSKNTQARVVRGTKKLKVDVSDNNTSEKKGLRLL